MPESRNDDKFLRASMRVYSIGVEAFNAPVTAEGHAGNLRVTVPKAVVRKLALPAPCWARFSANGCEPFFAFARRPPSRPSVDVGLPSRLFDKNLAGTEIACSIEHAEPYRARPLGRPTNDFDWLPFVTEHYFPTETVDGKLVIHNRYEEPFVMRRTTARLPTYRLLGLYQAEGSKSERAPDFTLAGNNPMLLAHAVELLRALGIPRERLGLEVLRAPDQTPESARSEYAALGVEIMAERVRTGKGGSAGVLHVRKSTPLLRLVRGALEHVFKGEFPSPEVAREYALGWLDGDGTITVLRNTGGIELRLAGYRDEQEVVLRALEHGFDWTLPKTSFGTVRSSTNRTLRLDQAAELAVHGGFLFSMSRARLIWNLRKRLVAQESRPRNWHGRGLTSPEHLHDARRLFDEHLTVEFERLSRHPYAAQDFILNQKGLPYPR